MSDKEKALLEGLAKLPEQLQEKLVEHINVAAMVIDTMANKAPEQEAEHGQVKP